MCSRDDKVEDLIKKVKAEFPNETIDVLYFNEDQIDVLDPLKYVNEILMQDEKIYFGPQLQNDVILELRKYQQEVLDKAVVSNK